MAALGRNQLCCISMSRIFMLNQAATIDGVDLRRSYSNNPCNQNRSNGYKRSCWILESPSFSFCALNTTHNVDLSGLSSCSRRFYARLSPTEVTTIIRVSESTEEIHFNSIKSFDTNQLPSNSPIEDTKAEARCLLTTGMLFGVFDGHGGPACAQVVAKRLFDYIAASLLPTDALHKLLNPNIDESVAPNYHEQLLETYHDHFDLVSDLHHLYNLSFFKYLQDLTKVDQTNFLMRTTMQNVFLRLDDDIAQEAQDETLLAAALSHTSEQDKKATSENVESLSRKTLSIAESGCVTVVAHIDREHLHVASVGDCQAVLGVRGQGESTWVALPLTRPHNSDNVDEVNRLLSEHPAEEKDKIVQNDRLLGQLAPFRAFGDVRFKWSKELIRKKLSPYLGDHAIIQHSITPPYLTAFPEVTYHKLRPQDRFLILGTDGLWDFLSPNEAVRLVGEHMSGKTVLSPFSLPNTTEAIPLETIHQTLLRRAESFKVKPIDSNAATHLVRHALGTTDYGLEHHRIANYLTLPKDSVRLFRDDITVQVIFFDSAYLRQRPL